MSDLREQIGGILHEYWRDVYRFEVGDGRQPRPDTPGTTDRILALVAEALLSDEAVEAAGDPVAYRLGEEWHEAASTIAKDAIRFALAAAGITTVQGEEAGT